MPAADGAVLDRCQGHSWRRRSMSAGSQGAGQEATWAFLSLR
jgi:hypothetical protein